MATVGRGALAHGSAQKTDHTLDAKGHTGLSRELRVLWSYSKSRDTWSGVHGPGQPTRLSGCLWAAASVMCCESLHFLGQSLWPQTKGTVVHFQLWLVLLPS